MKRWGTVTAIAAAAALALAGCSAGGASEVVSGTSISVAQNAAMTSMNSLTSTGYSTYNSNIAYLYQGPGFNYYDNSPKLVKNTSFGTYTKVSDSPLTIKYTINDGVKWTDGLQVSAADMILAWGSSISKYNSSSGVNFGSINQGSGLDLVTTFPTIDSDNRTITIKYDKPYVDWEILPTITPNLSAAVVWEEAGIDSKTGADAQNAVISAFKNNNTSELTKLAKVWKSSFDMTTTPSDKKLLTTYGPYKVSSLTKQYVSLVPNDSYTGGPKPKIAKITVKFIADQTAQVQALQNGDVNILYGQATADTVAALKGVANVKSTTTGTATFEHVDLQFDQGPFAPSTYGGDANKALLVRQAFMHTIPRTEMLDRLIKPISSSATLTNSSLFLPGQPGYEASAAANGSSAYATTDIAKAKALLAQAGVTTPVTVRFAYANDNPRRQNEFALIQASAAQAGFTVTDVGKPGAEFFDPGTGIGSGKYSYDATVFAYQLSSSSVTQSQANTTSGNAYNYQKYSNPNVDALWQKAVVATSSSAAVPFQQQIDAYLWKDASTISLFQLPDVTAWSSSISNVSDAPYSPNVFWNFWQWSQSTKTGG